MQHTIARKPFSLPLSNTTHKFNTKKMFDTENIKNELGTAAVTVLTLTAGLAALNAIQEMWDKKAIAAGKPTGGMETAVAAAALMGAGVVYASTQENPYMKAAGNGLSGAGGLKLIHFVVNKGTGTTQKDANGNDVSVKRKLNLGLGEIETGDAYGFGEIETDLGDDYDTDEMAGYKDNYTTRGMGSTSGYSTRD